MKKEDELKVSVSLKSGLLNNIPVLIKLSYGLKEINLKTGNTTYKPLLYYTPLTVNRDEWDFSKNRPLFKEKIEELESIIVEAKNTFKFLMRSKKEGEFLTHDELRNGLDVRIKGSKDRVIKTVRLVDFINDEILATKIVSEERKKAYRTLRNKLIDFESEIGREIFSADFDAKMYRRFMDNEKNRETMTSINSIWSIQKNIKTTLRKLGKKYNIKVFNPSEDLERGEIVKAEVANTAYFNMEQIKKIIECKPDNEKMENIKFILMILIFTGCRESDVYKIKPEFQYSQKGENFQYSKYTTDKGEIDVVTPILKPLQWMFNKHNGDSPKKITQKTFNKEVKMFAMKCGLNEIVTLTNKDAHGEKKTIKEKFYQLVSSHIGRRSFITNLINFIPLPTLTKITGHVIQDNEIIYGYNKISLVENAALFRRQLKKVIEENKDDFPVQLV